MHSFVSSYARSALKLAREQREEVTEEIITSTISSEKVVKEWKSFLKYF